MTAKTLSSHYEMLNPEERFRLILAALSRGDDTERERLKRDGGVKTLQMSDHAPYAMAFTDLSDWMFMDLHALSADYLEGIVTNDMVRGHLGIKDIDDRCPLLDLTLAQGYELKAKRQGWESFCHGLDLPATFLWEKLPGYERLERARVLSQRVAFVEEGYVLWLNGRRPQEERMVYLTAEHITDELNEFYLERANRWKGSSSFNANR